MKTAIHNVEPKNSAERVAAFKAQIEQLAQTVANMLGGSPATPAKPEPIANLYTAPAGDDDAPARGQAACSLGYRLPEGD